MNRTRLIQWISLVTWTVTPICSVRADDIQAATSEHQAVIGSAYQSDTQTFPGYQCVTGTTTYTGTSGSGFNFSDSISQTQLSSELGFGMGMKESYGAASASAAAKFLSQAASDDFSVSAAWESSYTFPSQKLSAPVITPLATSLQDNSKWWHQTCGDQLVDEITQGAQLFFSIRIDFASKQDKESFQAEFSVSGAVASATANLNQASQQVSQNATLTVAAYQVGGDVSKLTALFGGTSGGTQLTQCQLGHLEQCVSIIQNFLSYATDTKSGFPSQLAPGQTPGPAILTYKTVPYEAIGIYPKAYPLLDVVVSEKREELNIEFEKQFGYTVAAERLLNERDVKNTHKTLIQREKDKVDHNIGLILAVSQICYTTPDKSCISAVNCILDNGDSADCAAANQSETAGLTQPLAQLTAVNPALLIPPSLTQTCVEAGALPENDPLNTTLQALRGAIVSSGAILPSAPSIGLTDCTQSPLPPTMSAPCAALTAYCSLFESAAQALKSLEISTASTTASLTDLDPLSTLTGLRSLSVRSSDVVDLLPISGLTHLQMLDLSGNQITDVSPVSTFTQLTRLNLSSNDIQDASPLSGLHRLQQLYLGNNNIADLSKLSSFPNLFLVDIRNNPIDKDSSKLGKFSQNLPTSTLVLH